VVQHFGLGTLIQTSHEAKEAETGSEFYQLYLVCGLILVHNLDLVAAALQSSARYLELLVHLIQATAYLPYLTTIVNIQSYQNSTLTEMRLYVPPDTK